MCGEYLCADCQHTTDGESGHVTYEVYALQFKEREEFRKTGKESKRMLALRGVPTDVEFPRNLKEILETGDTDFSLAMCHYVVLKHGLMGVFPAILKNTQIMIITPDKEAIKKVWRSLEPRESELIQTPWMVHKNLGVGYQMVTDAFGQEQSLPERLFSKEEIEAEFLKTPQPFVWAWGLIGGRRYSPEGFEELIHRS